MTQKASDNPRLRHPCPYCGAKRGYPCKDSSGFDTYTLHAKRPLDEGLSRRPPSAGRRKNGKP